MENNLENRVSMFQKTLGYLELHASDMTDISAIATLKTELNTRITEILTLATAADTDITGYTVEKQSKRNDLKASILKLSTAMVANASLTDNYALIEKCDETPAGMDAMRDNDFYTYAKLVLNESNGILNDLTPFGIINNDWDTANDNSNKYLAVIQGPRVQISERSKVLEDLNNAVGGTDTFLNEKLDKVMGIYMASKPSLHSGYLVARSIDDTGANTPPDYENTVAANGITPVAELPYLAVRSFDIKNTGSVPLIFCLSSNATAVEGNFVSIEPNGFATRKTVTLNADTNASHLLFQNADPVLSGSYKIWITE
jgi:hypothetical protein